MPSLINFSIHSPLKNRYAKYLIAVAALLLIGTIVIYNKPHKTNWSPSFSTRGKIPYGTYVLKQQLKDIFPSQTVRENYYSYYTFFKEQGLENDANTNLLIISKDIEPDPLESKRLIEYVKRGNSMFIACTAIKGKLADSLKISYSFAMNLFQNKGDSGSIDFVNPSLKKANPYTFRHLYQLSYFEKFDTTNTTLLGVDENKRAVFIEIKLGKGSIFLHSLPAVFSNYGLLYNHNDEYAANCLSYLPQRTIIWDEYFKPDRIQNQDLFRYLLSEDSLRSAYYLTFIGLILFFAFGTKRRQRAIQVIRKPVNASLEFMHTVGRLYFRRKNNHDLVSKQYSFLLDHLRTKYYLHIHQDQTIDVHEVSQKTGIKHKTVMDLFAAFTRLMAQSSVSDSDLINLNRMLERMKSEEV